MKKATIVAALTLLAVATAFALVNNSLSESKSDVLPPGKWAINAHAYVGPMYESQPVKVIGIISDATKGFKVTTVGLKNTSEKAVSAVKLSWYVSSDQSGNAVLLQGETPAITLTGGLPVGESNYFETPVVSFGRVCKPLLKNGGLQGVFSIEVAVTEILYEDGSIWSGDPKNMMSAHKAGLRVGPVPQGCAGQMCQYEPGLGSYICVTGVSQLCTNCGRRCLSSVCGEKAPTCGPGGGGE